MSNTSSVHANGTNKAKRKAPLRNDETNAKTKLTSSSSNKRQKVSSAPLPSSSVDNDNAEADDAKETSVPARLRASNPFLATFWDLSSIESRVRSSAQDKLVAALSEEQSAVGSGGDAVDENHVHLAAKVFYAVRRLIRGLCSSRDGARVGFGDALVAILRQLDVITINDIIDAMDVSLKLPDGPTREERTDFKIGHALTISALHRARRLSDLPNERIISNIHELLENQTSHVARPYATAAIVALMTVVDFAAFQSQVESSFMQTFNKTKSEQTDGDDGAQANGDSPIELDTLSPDELSLLIALQRRYKKAKQAFAHASKFAASAQRPFHKRSLPQLTVCLLQTSRSLPSLHIIWTQLWDALLKSSAEDKEGKSRVSWHEVWKAVVDNALITKSTSNTAPQQRQVALLLLDHLIHRFNSDSPRNISLILSPHMMRLVLVSLKDSALPYHPAAEQVRTSLLSVAEPNPSLLMPIITALVKTHAQFDHVSRTKTLSTLIDLLRTDESRMRQYLRHLNQMMDRIEDDATADDAQSLNEHRQWIFDQIYQLSKYARAMPNIITLIVQFFIFHGYFNSASPSTNNTQMSAKKKNKQSKRDEHESANALVIDSEICTQISSPLSESLVEFAQSRLLTLLAENMKQSKAKSVQMKKKADADEMDTTDESKEQEASVDLILLSHHIFDALSAAGWQQLTPLEDEELSVRRQTLSLVDSISAEITREESAIATSDQSKTEILERRQRIQRRMIIRTLLLYIALSQWNDVETSTDLLEDVQVIYRRVFPVNTESVAEKKTKKKSKKSADADADEPAAGESAPIEVLMDVVLSLLVKPTSLYRDIGKQVFQCFCADLNETALTQLTDVLQRRPSTNSGGDDDDDDEFAPIDIDMTEDKDDESEVKETRSKKRKAEATAAVPASKKLRSDKADDDEESDDEEIGLNTLTSLLDSDLTEAEIAAIERSHIDEYDHHLANIIRMRKTKSTDERDAKQQIEQFQLRVIELIEVFLNRHSDSPLTIHLYQPLLACADQNKRSKDAAITNRIGSVVRKSLCKGKHPVADSVTSTSDDDQSNKNKSKRAADVPAAEPTHSPTVLVSLKSVHTTMSALMDFARKSNDSLMVTLCSDMLISLIRMSTTPEHSTFVINLYRSALIHYMTARRTNLNSKMFTDVVHRFPHIAAHWIDDIANMCTMPSDKEHIVASLAAATEKPKKKDRKSSAAARYNGPFAVHSFRRNECFELLNAIISHKSAVASTDDSASVIASARQHVMEAIESNLKAALLPMEQRIEIDKAITELSKQAAAEQRLSKANEDTAEAQANEDSDDDDADNGADDNGDDQSADVSTLSAAEREKFRLKMKRKRRQQRKAEAMQRAALNRVSQTHSQQNGDGNDKSVVNEKTFDKRTVAQMKEYFKLATALLKNEQTTLSLTFKDALSLLPAKYATPAQHVIRNLLKAANIDENSVQLHINAENKAAAKVDKAKSKSTDSSKKHHEDKKAKGKANKTAPTATSARDRNVNSYRIPGSKPAHSASQPRSATGKKQVNKKQQSPNGSSNKESRKSRRALASVQKPSSKKKTSSIKIANKNKKKNKYT